jgi:GT2 family glycosyltransferase
MPSLSIIIPTLNRYPDLKNTIRDLQKQNLTDFEILIIDQSEPGIREDLGYLDQRIRYFESTERSASAARNVGIREARSEVLLFIDDDVIIEDPAYLNHHLDNYTDPNVPGVVGCTLEKAFHTDTTDQLPPRCQDQRNGWLFFPQNYSKRTLVASGRSNNLSVRRSVAIAVGGMDEQYEKGAHREEADFCLRVSKKFGHFWFDPNARLIHIGNAQGGIRSWQGKSLIKSRHHFVGAIYFIFNLVERQDYPLHFWLTLRYFVLNGPLLRKPWLLPKAMGRFIGAAREAYQKYKQGPKLLDAAVPV